MRTGVRRASGIVFRCDSQTGLRREALRASSLKGVTSEAGPSLERVRRLIVDNSASDLVALERELTNVLMELADGC
jgi:hypothetical protein